MAAPRLPPKPPSYIGSNGGDSRRHEASPSPEAPRIPSMHYSPTLASDGRLDSLMSDLQLHMQGYGEDQHTALPPPPQHQQHQQQHYLDQPGLPGQQYRSAWDAVPDSQRPISSASGIINLYASAGDASSDRSSSVYDGTPPTHYLASQPAAPSPLQHQHQFSQSGLPPAPLPDSADRMTRRVSRPLPPPPQRTPASSSEAPHTPLTDDESSMWTVPAAAVAPTTPLASTQQQHQHTPSSFGVRDTPPSWSPEVSAIHLRGAAARAHVDGLPAQTSAGAGRQGVDATALQGALGMASRAPASASSYAEAPQPNQTQWEQMRAEAHRSPPRIASPPATQPARDSPRIHRHSNEPAGWTSDVINAAASRAGDNVAWDLTGTEGVTFTGSGRDAASPLHQPQGRPGAIDTLAHAPLHVDVRQAQSSEYDRFGRTGSPPAANATGQSSGRSSSHVAGSSTANWSDFRPSLLSPTTATSFQRSVMTPISHVASTSGVDMDFALLSNVAVLLRDSVPRGTQIKGSVSYPFSFTGKDVVSTIQALIPREHAAWAAGLAVGQLDAGRERRVALLVAKTLKSQLFFHEVDWGTNELRDGVEEVYMFLEDSLAGSASGANTPGGAARGGGEDENAFERELHSEKDTRSGARRNGANDLDELPTGVFTPLTACYSPLCGKPDAPPGSECYSLTCPRANASALQVRLTSAPLADAVAAPPSGELSRWGQPMQSAQSGATGKSHMALAWADLVAPELLKSVPKKEVKRQNAILETIQKEEEFLSDLELLETLFLHRLERPSEHGDPPPIPIGPERDAFVAEVFSNHRELVGHIRRLVERLHVRQREESPIVQSIGDIFLDAALEWGGAFDTNMTNFPLAKNRIQREASVNPRFVEFLEACRRDPACHRLPMDNFLQRATTRLPRYKLHFKSILEDTEENSNDRDSLARAIEIVDEQCRSIQKGVAEAETRVRIREYAYNLATKRNKVVVDMDLLNPERQLVHQGRVYRKPAFQELDWVDLLAVLFDNYLVVTRTKKREEDNEGGSASSKFLLVKRPIPVEMMELSGFNEPSVSRSIGLSNFHLRNTSERESRDLWPFTIHHIGGKTEPLTLFCSSRSARDDWKRKLEEAQGLRAAVQDANKVFEAHTVSDDVFAIPAAASIDPDRPPAGVDPAAFHGRVTCAVPFQTADGRGLVAIGCADGVWIGLRHDPRSLRKVLHLKLVSQCAVLESFGIFVVLADKVLISYSLEALVPSAGATSAPRPPQKLSGNRDVVFFSVGQLKERTLLVYMKKKANESVFRALEPVHNAQHADSARGAGGLLSRFGRENKSTDWFRIYKTFFIPSEAYSMQFLRSKLCIVCARGFEIMNLDTLLPGTIPDFSQCPRDDPRIQLLANRVERAKPLGMFKNSEAEFLLCYDAFACYVDRLGEPIRLDNVIEWEGTPHSVAFRAPYILAFDHRFVEIRDSSTGQLVQLIRTVDLRYVSGSTTLANENDASIILVQRRRANGRMPFDYQQVFELVSSHPTQLVRADTTLTSRTFASGGSRASSGWF